MLSAAAVSLEVMTLHLHRAGGTDVLADGLAQLLSTPLDDPFEEEVVAVPAKGVERWLAQRLSHRLGATGVDGGGDDGVCAGVRFLNPHSLTALVLGIERDDPWRPEQLTWPVLRAIDESLNEEWAVMLATHLGHGVTGEEGQLRRGRRYAVARRLAGLFADYAAQRPTVLEDWLGEGEGDGAGWRVEHDLAWQPRLWRRVVDLVDAEPPQVRHARVVGALETSDLGELDLPGRLSLFGHTRIARAEVQVLAALARHREVHLWLPQASGAAWSRIAEEAGVGPVPREEDVTAALVRHRLSAGLGRDARELQRTLAVARPVEHDLDSVAAPAPDMSLLNMLQADIRADRPPSASERAARVVPARDRSVQVHACHGPSRQIEVLRDVLADLLQRDPSLEPRDILVMCPDIDAFAPLVHAGFGLGEVTERARRGPGQGHGSFAEGFLSPPAGHPAHGLRVRLADRAPLQVNPLMTLAARLVELAGSRLTAPQVLDLARSAPVRYRFGFADDDLALLAEWVDKVAIRWGLDAEHRDHYRLSLTQNTWSAGLDRVLVGAALDGREHDHLGGVLGLDDLDSGDLELAGRCAEMVDRLGAALRALAGAQGVSEWVGALQTGVSALADVPLRDAWMSAALGSELARVAAAADEAAQTGAAAGAGSRLALSLADVRALLAEHGQGRPTRSSFRTGMLTVCTMVPMRSVPHRVVCLLGLDDGVFPRTSVPDGDDLLARHPLTGERDARSEDRQLLLDALMSARETLVVTYSGADEHSGQQRPPAVPLGEVIDAVRATACGPGVDRLVTRHPLQPFDPRNLGASGSLSRADQATDTGADTAAVAASTLLPDDEPFSYDPVALAGGLAGSGPQSAPMCIAQRRLKPVSGPSVSAGAQTRHVDLDELLRFFDHPARAYLRNRLGLLLPEVPEPGAEGIPIELDGLARWTIGDRLLASVLAGRAPADAITAEQLRGELPPGRLGERALGQISTLVTQVCHGAWQVAGHGGWGSPLHTDSLDIDVTLPDGRQLLGTVAGMVGAGPDTAGRALQVTYSALRAKQRLRSWITSLALSAAGTQASSHVVGQFSAFRRKGIEELAHGPHDTNGAIEMLGQLVALRDAGMCEPLPLPPKTSLAWARAYLLGPGEEVDAHRQAEREWATNTGFSGVTIPGEQDDPSHVRVYDGAVPLATILGTVLPQDRWTPGVISRLGQLSLRLWRPLLLGDAEAGVAKEVSRRS